MKIGLALSGGGARGISHLGVIQALEEMGIQFSIISGTSAGAIVGSLYSYGYRPKEILEIIQHVSVFKSIRPAWLLTGVLSLDGLRDVLLSKMPENNFNKLKIPLFIAATDLKKGVIKYFDNGELVLPVMASSCVPAVFAPININGEVYVDGGVLDNLPVKPIRDHCDFLIGVSCNPISADFDVKNIRAVIERSLLMAVNTNTLNSKTKCNLLIESAGLHKISGFEIGKAQDIFEIGYEYTKKNFSLQDFVLKSA